MRTGAHYGADPLRQAAARGRRSGTPDVELLLGNWRNASLVGGRRFDVVLLDYLLAAVHMHWPYAEEEVLWRVLQTVKPGGVALLTGIEPYELDLHPDEGARRGATATERAADGTIIDVAQRGRERWPPLWSPRRLEAWCLASPLSAHRLRVAVGAGRGAGRRGRAPRAPPLVP